MSTGLTDRCSADRLLRIADVLPALLGSEGAWFARAVYARFNGEAKSLDHALGLIERGGVSPAQRKRLSKRDGAIVAIWREFFAEEGTREAAKEMAAAFSRFKTRRWPKLEPRSEMPAELVGTLDGMMFLLFKDGTPPLTARRIETILGNSMARLNFHDAPT